MDWLLNGMDKERKDYLTKCFLANPRVQHYLAERQQRGITIGNSEVIETIARKLLI
ncbi:MAG: hypothetical protein AABX04_00670 [Nanoarchaeota archaeon]